ncbi:MAG: pseudouridine synthase [Bacteroides sp.]|nr:pseudouridine synthase [Prevotella sp.]MCM1408331.1 pseudouridine synthase [Treponema brennaborense]MCM1470437.1 pseudouridine synthase [Bacteroides sp.]
MADTEPIPAADRILYADNDICIVNKLPGEICQSFCSSDADKPFLLPNIFYAEICRMLRCRTAEIFCPHRIDRPVSGIAVLALNAAAAGKLSAIFSSRLASKTYLAVAEGIQAVSDSWKQENVFLCFDTKHQKARIFDTKKTGTKHAELLWRCIGTGKRYSYIMVQPQTGRTHQIRAQLAAIGMHIKGDVKYGAKRTDTIPGIRLHAVSAAFEHPVSGKPLKITAPIMHADALWNDCFSAYKNITAEKGN